MNLLDTNVLVENFENNILPNKSRDFISRISYIEFLSYSQLSVQDSKLIEIHLEKSYTILELSKQVANTAYLLRKTTKSLKLADAIILATAKNHSLNLITKDKQLIKLVK